MDELPLRKHVYTCLAGVSQQRIYHGMSYGVALTVYRQTQDGRWEAWNEGWSVIVEYDSSITINFDELTQTQVLVVLIG